MRAFSPLLCVSLAVASVGCAQFHLREPSPHPTPAPPDAGWSDAAWSVDAAPTPPFPDAAAPAPDAWVAIGSCDGRGYCDCTGDYVPLIDLTFGCICPCDEPFQCGGPPCACSCGGAHYLGCAVFGQCTTTQISCMEGSAAVIGGCPVCASR